jgi:predicted acetyltransferase
MSIIRKLEERDLERFFEITKNAYPGFSMGDYEKFKERTMDTQANNPTVDFYGLFRNDELLGGMRIHDFRMNFHQQMINACGIGLVAVDLVHKKEKVCKEMLDFYIDHYRENGASVALLYPFRPDFYKKMGFGYGTQMHQYKIVPTAFPKGKSKSHLEFLSKNDTNAICDCYNDYARKTHGLLEKLELDFSRLFKNPNLRVLGYKDEGKLLGYMLFAFKKQPDKNVLINDLEIYELIHHNLDAFMEFSTFLHTQADQVRRIIYTTQDPDFYHLLADIRSDTDKLIPPVYHESNTSGMGIMYKVIDLKRFFEETNAHNFGGQTCRVKFSVTDSFTPDNEAAAKRFAVNIVNGTPEIVSDEDIDVEISCDISVFSSIVMGVLSFKKAWDYGLVSISDSDYIQIIHKMFYSEEKPLCMTSF